MATRRKIECERKRSRLVIKYRTKRQKLKNRIKSVRNSKKLINSTNLPLKKKRLIKYFLLKKTKKVKSNRSNYFIFSKKTKTLGNRKNYSIELVTRLSKQLKRVKKIQQLINLQTKLHKLPRNSSSIRRKNRCWATGRSRGFYRDFGLSRHVLREMGFKGLIPGLKKSSW